MGAFFRSAPGVDLARVDRSFLSVVERAVRAGGGLGVLVTSGYRDPGRNVAAGGVSGSEHLFGQALDGFVLLPGGRQVPLGTFLRSSAAGYGLRSGDQPGFYRGRPDPVHVDAGGGSSGVKTIWSTELLRLLRAPLTPANYRFLNQWAAREHKGGAALSDGSNNPFFTTAGAGGTVGPLKAGTFPAWNSVGVATYPTLETGVFANAYHIDSEYGAIAAALRSGNPAAAAGNPQFQSELKRWSGGGYEGFAAIPAPAGPVGPSVDDAKLHRDATAAVKSGAFGVDSVTGALRGAAEYIPGVKQVEQIGGAAGDVAGFVGRITDPSYILRALQILAGAGLVGIGLLLLARQVGLAADLPVPVSPAAPSRPLSGVVQ